MKKLLPSVVLGALLLFAASWTADAAVPVTPTVVSVEPASGFNDIDTRVTITGGDFVAGVDGTATVALGGTQLTDVTWVDTQTLTATVPWGMDPRAYGLTVTNPGGAAATLPSAFTVTQGIGQWNSGTLNGASVRQLLVKPGDPNTLYALAYDVGLFRSRDAGASWSFISNRVIGNTDFVLDPNHPSWLYAYTSSGLFLSKDEGSTWTLLLDTSQGGIQRYGEVFVSPHDPSLIFVATYDSSPPTALLGLQKSTNSGATWTQVPSLNGIPVQCAAFDPTPGSHDMVLATSDARVFKSTNDGSTWSQVATAPVTALGMTGSITYNPYKPSEVWLSSTEISGGIFKTTGPGMTSWVEVSPFFVHSGYNLTFAGPDDIYIWHAHSTDGGATWHDYGPWPWHGTAGQVVFPGAGTQTAYVSDETTGVQKTIDGGLTWAAATQGLTGMRCVSMSVSKTDPLRVYAAFNSWSGVYRSDDGTTHWTFLPIADSSRVWQVLEDPFDSGRLLVSADTGFYTSTTGGESWNLLGWNGVPDPSRGLMDVLAADPHHAGHLLVAMRVGNSSSHDHDSGFLFSSTDGGASWQSATVTLPIDSLGPILAITFDPEIAGTIYLASDGSGLFRSTDNGGSWTRIDDRAQPFMQGACGIGIATHPQRVLAAAGDSGRIFTSVDNGATWQSKEGDGEVASKAFAFLDGDSRRLYATTWNGLFFSSDLGIHWTHASGVLGRIQSTALAYADADGHTILYAATTGGDASSAGASVKTAATAAGMVGAGIYRYAQVVVPTSITIKTAATSTTIGRTVALSGRVTPTGMVGVNIVVYVQKPGSARWTYSSNRTAYSLGGAPAWLYKYYFKRGMAKGAYKFKAVAPAPGFASSAGFGTSTSPTMVTIRVR
jgi:hypothetical protein